MNSFPTYFTHEFARNCIEKKQKIVEDTQEKLLAEAREKFVESIEHGPANSSLFHIQLHPTLTANSKSKLINEITNIFSNVTLQKSNDTSFVFLRNESDGSNYFSDIVTIYVEL